MSKLPPLKHYLPIPDNGYNNKYNHIPQWPFRLLICGSSGSGKTNLLLNLILQYLSYDRLLVYAKDLSEPKYEYLQELFNKNNDEDDDDDEDEEEVLFSSDDKVISVDELDPNKQNLIVFDDYITSRDQNKIEDLFIRGRKKNVSIIYLTQSYYQTPKNIRLQCNYLILFRSRKKETKTKKTKTKKRKTKKRKTKKNRKLLLPVESRLYKEMKTIKYFIKKIINCFIKKIKKKNGTLYSWGWCVDRDRTEE